MYNTITDSDTWQVIEKYVENKILLSIGDGSSINSAQNLISLLLVLGI